MGGKAARAVMAGRGKAAVESLYRDHGAAALRLAFLLTGDRSGAEDLVHDAFVKVLGRLRSIRDPQALRAYLNRTVVNLAKNDYRRNDVRDRHNRSARVGTSVVWLPDIPARDELHTTLLELPYRQMAAVVLRYCEDMSELEVAQALGTSPKAVRSLVGRGLAALREPKGEMARV